MKRQAGFTLIELLSVVALVGIMLAIAVPSFRSFISSYRVTSAGNDFLQAVVQTRAEAMKRGRRVLMMPNDATGAPSVSGDWKNGWTVFVDLNGNQVLDSGDVLITNHAPLDQSTVPTDANGGSMAFIDTASKVYVSFDGTGYPRFLTGGLQIGGITFTDSMTSPASVRTLCVASMGAARIYKGATTCT